MSNGLDARSHEARIDNSWTSNKLFTRTFSLQLSVNSLNVKDRGIPEEKYGCAIGMVLLVLCAFSDRVTRFTKSPKMTKLYA